MCVFVLSIPVQYATWCTVCTNECLGIYGLIRQTSNYYICNIHEIDRTVCNGLVILLCRQTIQSKRWERLLTNDYRKPQTSSSQSKGYKDISKKKFNLYHTMNDNAIFCFLLYINLHKETPLLLMA